MLTFEQSPVNRLVPCPGSVPVDEFTVFPNIEQLSLRTQDDAGTAKRVWIQIWHVLATICQTRIWVDRNAAVYKGVTFPLSAASAVYELRASVISEQPPRESIKNCDRRTWCLSICMH